jgi:hypothetical protein
MNLLPKRADNCARCAINKVATTVSNTGGGFLVPSEIGAEIWRLVDTYSSFRNHANIVTLPTGNFHMPRITGGTTAYFVGETDTITPSDFSGDWIGFHAKKLGCLARLSSEFDEDTVGDFGAALAREFAIAIGTKMDGASPPRTARSIVLATLSTLPEYGLPSSLRTPSGIMHTTTTCRSAWLQTRTSKTASSNRPWS